MRTGGIPHEAMVFFCLAPGLTVHKELVSWDSCQFTTVDRFPQRY